MQVKKDYANLFDAPERFALAHCIAYDCKLGAGIALQFRKRYPEMIKYLNQNKTSWPSVVKYCANDNKVIFNIITKERSHYKPTRKDFEEGLVHLKTACEENNITHLAIPLIGAGLDNLEWDESEKYIRKLFANMDIHIAICILKKES